MGQEVAKIAAAEKALERISDGMVVGLGSGTTAHFFIERLGQKCRDGLAIKAVASSKASADLAKKGGIVLEDINAVSHIDITVDGADEVDGEKRMIKGAGGAHVREKILANNCQKLLIVVDETKLVKTLGQAKLPVEILFYGAPMTRQKIENKNFKGAWRLTVEKTPFMTDNGNLLLDLEVPPHKPLEKIDEELRQIPGVVATGFFANLGQTIIVGGFDGSCRWIN